MNDDNSYEFIANKGFSSSDGRSDCFIGQNKADVRQRLGQPVEFQRFPDSAYTDDFETLGIQVTYDSAGEVGFIEVFEPAQVLVRGMRAIGSPGESIYRRLREAGSRVFIDEFGASVPDEQLFFYEEDGRIAVVSAGDNEL